MVNRELVLSVFLLFDSYHWVAHYAEATWKVHLFLLHAKTT
jgi:hypothetical protein